MGLKMHNVKLSPRSPTTSIVSHDGENWFTNDGKPVDLKDIVEDNAGADFIGALFFVGLLFAAVYGICWLFGVN